MGCSESNAHDTTYIIELDYCGSCGWTGLVNQIASAIKNKFPRIPVDCRAEDKYTGLLEVYLIQKGVKQKVYSGDKKSIATDIEKMIDLIASDLRSQKQS